MNDHIFQKIFAVFRREFAALTGTVAAWIFIAMFLILSGFLTFMISDILESGQADLGQFFNWMPWLFLFVVPALAMPLWSEERRTGTLELSLSYPVSVLELVVGKFLAGEAVLILALALTIGTPLTIAHLGEPDINAVICGYFGAFMAGTIFLAISCFCSAMTRSQTASFLLSLLLCGLMIFSGWDKISNYMAAYLPQWLCTGIEKFSLIPHYQAFQRGLIDTVEIVYALLTTMLFLYLTATVLTYSTSGIGGLFLPGAVTDRYTWKQIARLAVGIVTALWIYFCLIYTAEVFSARYDATADKAYSLTPLTRELIPDLQKPVEIRFYLSESESDRFRPLEQYGKRVEWLLRDLAKDSGGRIRLYIIPLKQTSGDEELAVMDGLKPVVRLETGERFYLGITVSCGANVLPVNDMTPEREDRLEYELIRAILNVSRASKPKVGIISAMPVLPDPSGQKGGGLRFAAELANDYDLQEIPFASSAPIPDDIAALLIFHPAKIPSETLFAIDQYLMRGGKVAVFIDPMLMRRMPNADPAAQLDLLTSDLAPLTNAWGIRFDREKILADMEYKFVPKALDGMMRVTPTFLSIPAAGFNTNVPIMNSRLSGLHLFRSGAFQIADPQKGLIYTPLVRSSDHYGLFPGRSMEEEILKQFSTPGFKPEPQPHPDRLPVVLHVSGNFRSAFGKDTAWAQARNYPSSSTGHPEVVLFADSDMLFLEAIVRVELDANNQRRE
ncbi:MAG: Gldg family protein, partial [Lentisphaeria bacterium]|nr:Gldg family protein [Lentisphaeria bacterium]